MPATIAMGPNLIGTIHLMLVHISIYPKPLILDKESFGLHYQQVGIMSRLTLSFLFLFLVLFSPTLHENITLLKLNYKINLFAFQNFFNLFAKIKYSRGVDVDYFTNVMAGYVSSTTN